MTDLPGMWEESDLSGGQTDVRVVVPADVVGNRMNLGGVRDSILTLHCVAEPVGCGRPLTAEEIHSWPMIDQKEYSMSGWCGGPNGCQDKVFKEPDDEDDGPWECVHPGIECNNLPQDFDGDCYCSCSHPCCEADVGVGVITCGSQHCNVHGLEASSNSSEDSSAEELSSQS